MLSKTAEYALRAIVYIALSDAQGLKAGIKEIAKELELPAHFMGKILQDLVDGINSGKYFITNMQEDIASS